MIDKREELSAAGCNFGNRAVEVVPSGYNSRSQPCRRFDVWTQFLGQSLYGVKLESSETVEYCDEELGLQMTVAMKQEERAQLMNVREFVNLQHEAESAKEGQI